MFRQIILGFLLILLLSSCFEKEKPIAPYTFSGVLFVFKQSMYTDQQFYSLSTNRIVNMNPNAAWDLSFESSSKGWRIHVNSGNLEEIYPTDSTRFEASSFNIMPKNWRFDKSNGDPDSTAVGAWVNTYTIPYNYKAKVYLLGQSNGSGYLPVKKFVFNLVNDTMYQFTYADLNGNNTHQITIKKDTTCNNSYFNISQGRQVTIEPNRNNWDLLFCQYASLLPNNGTFLPYNVRGVLINPNNVSVALDSTKGFDNISINDAPSFSLNNSLDFIGFNWKYPIINYQSVTAIYLIRQNYTYIVRDVTGAYYKIKFLSFYNTQGLEGYPSFEIFKL